MEVAGLGRDGDHHVLIRNHDAQLAAGPVAAKRIVSAAPELKAVALLPIDADLGVGFLLVRHLLGRGLFDPCLRDQLFAIPFAFLQIKLTELGDVFRAKLEAIAAERIAFGAAVPSGFSIPSGSNNRGFRNSSVVWPVTLVTMAESV